VVEQPAEQPFPLLLRGALLILLWRGLRIWRILSRRGLLVAGAIAALLRWVGASTGRVRTALRRIRAALLRRVIAAVVDRGATRGRAKAAQAG